ncbi:ester cyclase [Pseudomonas sp. MPB23]|uniref:nuclear transport factor 2 family protein n=1 Tax=Pseudomonas sp. MPB23 TaxID=3388490 RepID=UPI003984CD54
MTNPLQSTDQAARNRQLVIDFYRHVFDARNPAAIKDFVTEDYQQHNSHLPDGRAGLEALVTEMFRGLSPLPVKPDLLMPSTLIVADGDVVVIAGEFPQPEPEDPTRTYPFFVFDAYRVRDGKLAEHWSGINKIAPPKHLEITKP